VSDALAISTLESRVISGRPWLVYPDLREMERWRSYGFSLEGLNPIMLEDVMLPQNRVSFRRVGHRQSWFTKQDAVLMLPD